MNPLKETYDEYEANVLKHKAIESQFGHRECDEMISTLRHDLKLTQEAHHEATCKLEELRCVLLNAYQFLDGLSRPTRYANRIRSEVDAAISLIDGPATALDRIREIPARNK